MFDAFRHSSKGSLQVAVAYINCKGTIQDISVFSKVLGNPNIPLVAMHHRGDASRDFHPIGQRCLIQTVTQHSYDITVSTTCFNKDSFYNTCLLTVCRTHTHTH